MLLLYHRPALLTFDGFTPGPLHRLFQVWHLSPPLFTPSLPTRADVLLPEEAAAADHALGTVWAGSCANSILFSFTVLLALVLAHDWKLLHPCLPPTRLGGATEAEGGFSMKYNKQSDSALSNPEKAPLLA